MKSVVISRKGGPEVLQLVDREPPTPGPGEVRVQVLATGVAYADVLMRNGLYLGVPPLPFAPGYDIVGVIESLGSNVSQAKAGDTVAALTVTGGYSQYIVLPETELTPVPSGLDPAEAVSLVLNYTTAYQMLHRTAQVKSGQRIFVHGLSGAVGQALLALGKIQGAEVFGTASRGKHEELRQSGAVPFDYSNKNWISAIKRNGLAPSVTANELYVFHP